MNQSQRDYSVDLIKGIGCICMVIAHAPMFHVADLLPRLIIHLVGFGTVFFFATAGITAALQARRYATSSLVFYFLIIFLFGSNWNIIIHGDLSAFSVVEIFQIIALGSILVCLLERNGPCPQWLLLAIALAFPALKFAADRFAPGFDGGGLLLPSNDYIPHHLVTSGKDRIFPGFALLPWLTFFPLGLFCYRASKRTNGIAMLVSLLVLLVAYLNDSVTVEKWDMSLAYLAGIYTCGFASFWFFKGMGAPENPVARLLTWIGQNVLPLFFFHPIAVVVGIASSFVIGPYLGWVAALVTAVLMLKFALSRKPWRIFEHNSAWIVLGLTLLALPVVAEILEGPWPMVARLGAFVIGIIFALNVSWLSRIIKKTA